MAYNTPVSYGTDRTVVSRTISPSDSGVTTNSTYVSPRIYKGLVQTIQMPKIVYYMMLTSLSKTYIIIL